MNTDDMISVIVPAYNHEKYIIDSLSSVVQQTYYNKQLIVIDDCSCDKTPAYIKRFIERKTVQELFPAGIVYKRHTKNRNAHQTINEGIQDAVGKYIAIINSDDCYEENRLEAMAGELKANHARFAFSKVQCIDGKGRYIDNKSFQFLAECIRKYPSPIFALAAHNVAIGTGNFVFEKDLCQEIGGFSSMYHFVHDWDFILRASLVCEPLYVESTKYLYRMHTANTIGQIKESTESENKKNYEVRMLLENFYGAVLNGNVKNQLLKDVEMWSYFMEEVSKEESSVIWRQMKQEKKYGV